jgi:hypothetical protein
MTDVERFSKGIKLMNEALTALSHGPFDHTLTCLLAAREALLTKYAPFKVGDAVALAVTPTIDEKTAPGWMSSRHFLKRGAIGVVRGSDVRSDGKLAFAVEFVDESWIDKDGAVHPATEKHSYHFGELALEHLKTPNVEIKRGT